jgi:hypothetical protein
MKNSIRHIIDAPAQKKEKKNVVAMYGCVNPDSRRDKE